MTLDDPVVRHDIGALVRQWRQRRRLSQQALSDRSGVSTRHLSFIETGRSQPSPAMIGQLSAALDVPLRDRRQLFTAAGFVPQATELPLGSPALAQVNAAIEMILAGHGPYPALVIDGGWNLVSANEAAYGLLDGVAAELLEPPVNVVRLSLHPRGLAPKIVGLEAWRTALMGRIRHEHDLTGDPRLADLLAEFPTRDTGGLPDIVLTIGVRHGDQIMSFMTTTTVFGTPGDVTVSELAIEALYPADRATRDLLQARHAARH